MIGIIDNQTKWYVDKSVQLKAVTKELRALNPIHQKRQKIALQLLCNMAAFAESVKRLTHELNALRNPLMFVGESAGYVGKENTPYEYHKQMHHPAEIELSKSGII